MAPSVSVTRLFTGSESAALAAAHVLRSSTWNLADAEAFLADTKNFLIVAESDGIPVGYCLAYEMTRLDGSRPMMCLYDLQVSEGFRRRGIGRTLVESLRAHCQANGFLKMWVLTDADNKAARALYEACSAEIQVDEPVLYWWRFGG